MKRLVSLLVMVMTSNLIFGQDILLSYMSAGDTLEIDSITAINLRTSEAIVFPGNQTLRLKTASGIQDFENHGGSLQVFPNPFSGNTTVGGFFNSSQKVNVVIFDKTGKLILSQEDNTQLGWNYFKISLQQPGLYFVSLISDESISTTKIICIQESYGKGHNSNVKIESLPNHTNTSPLLKLSQDPNTLNYQYGDILHFHCTSETYKTLISDSPEESKTYSVEFHDCVDPSGKQYETVKIENQIWMAENLTYLPEVCGSDNRSSTSPKYYVYDNLSELVEVAKETMNYQKYGALYNWPSVLEICPQGWHVPSQTEWLELESSLGGPYIAGGKMKSLENWDYPNESATNSSGFSALPGGDLDGQGKFNHIRQSGFWWTSSFLTDSTASLFRSLHDSPSLENIEKIKSGGASVRCIKDQTTAIKLPTVITNQVTILNQSSARCGGVITDDGNDKIIACGLCWNASGSPTIENIKTSDDISSDEFYSLLKNLVPNTNYYVRAYATNSFGTAYGKEVNFKIVREYFAPSYHLRKSHIWIDLFDIPAQNGINLFGRSYDNAFVFADFNGDQIDDILMAWSDNTTERHPIEIFLWNENSAEYTLDNTLISNNLGPSAARRAIVSDFNNDGKPDVFFADHGSEVEGGWSEIPSILLSSPTKYNFKILDFLPKEFYHGATAGDIDNDGDIDIFLSNGFFLINNGLGEFQKDETIFQYSPAGIFTTELIDINNDGFLDLLLGGHTYGHNDLEACTILWGNGRNYTDSNKTFLPEIHGWGVSLDFWYEDLNNDGRNELIILRSGGEEDPETGETINFYRGYRIQILQNTGNYRYADITESIIENFMNINRSSQAWIRIQDIDYNGKLDLFFEDRGDGITRHAIRWEQDTDGIFKMIENEPPTIEILNPNDLEFVSDSIVFKVKATDDFGVMRVQFEIFYESWVMLGQDSTSSNENEYSIIWDTKAFEDGLYNLSATVYDSTGQHMTSNVSINILNDNSLGSFIYDSREYKYKMIGTQTWMIENLAYLPEVAPPTEGSAIEPYYYVLEYNGTNVAEAKATNHYEQYGVLYNYEAAKIVCPPGWHLPNDSEWKTLEKFLGMSASDANASGWRSTGEVGKKLKSTNGWYREGNGDNSSGFNALTVACRDASGIFNGYGFANFWTSTKDVTPRAWCRRLASNNHGIARAYYSTSSGFSVRCIKDI